MTKEKPVRKRDLLQRAVLRAALLDREKRTFLLKRKTGNPLMMMMMKKGSGLVRVTMISSNWCRLSRHLLRKPVSQICWLHSTKIS